ncbi:hypothetical protein M5689_018972 [Euphorbia peplus]|nr:hypothetical protein M5689_018972 [Euphorbia peplus]
MNYLEQRHHLDNTNKDWRVVIKPRPRDLYDMPSQIDDDNDDFDDLGDAYQEGESFDFQCGTSFDAANGDNWARPDSSPIVFNVSKATKKRKRKTRS